MNKKLLNIFLFHIPFIIIQIMPTDNDTKIELSYFNNDLKLELLNEKHGEFIKFHSTFKSDDNTEYDYDFDKLFDHVSFGLSKKCVNRNNS